MVRKRWKSIERTKLSLAIDACIIAMLIVGCGNDDSNILGISWVSSSPGSHASDFMSDTEYKRLVVELQPIADTTPTQTTIDNLTQFLEQRLRKPSGIEIVVKPVLPTYGQEAYSIGQIKQIEVQSRTRYPGGNTMAAFLLMIDGESDESTGNARILGHAYGGTSIVIYQYAIKELSGGVAQPPRHVLESAVINHEFGHIMGLVGNGSAAIDPGHHDQPHGAHCTNSECLMHYTVETSDIIANLLGGSIPDLDADCINDLRNNGGK